MYIYYIYVIYIYIYSMGGGSKQGIQAAWSTPIDHVK